MGKPGQAYALVTKVLLGLGLLLSAYPLLRAFYHFEIDYNEGWNAYLQLRAAQGEPLYSGFSPYWFNNYPPLSFYLAGLVGKLTGDVVLAGRLLSLAGFAAMALAGGYTVRAAGASREDGRLATALCLLLYATFATDYLGMNDPQLLGMGFATWGLALYVAQPLTARRAALSALLLAAGALTKHNLVLLPLLVGLHMLWRGEPKAKVAFVVSAATCAVLAIAAIWLFEGPAFFTQFFGPRDWQVDRAFLFVTELTGKLQAPLALVALGLIAMRRNASAGLVLTWLVGALLAGIYFAGGAGTDINVWFDAMTAAAIGAGLVVRELRERGGTQRMQAALALTIAAGALFQAPLALGRFGVDVAGDMAERERQFAADVQWLRSVPGKAICESQLLCLKAGKPMFYDSFNALQAMHAGRLPPDSLASMLRRHEVAVVVVNSRRQHNPDDLPGQTMPTRFVNFDDVQFDVLEQEYHLARVGVSGRFYLPKSR
ncbi:MAG: hypothetical protein AB7F98_07635 [Novosphingobium sp.]